MKKKIQTTEKNVQKLTMKQLPKEDRPYEKCLTQGARFLTDEELLAVIIRTGSKDATSLEPGQKHTCFRRSWHPSFRAFTSFPERLLPYQRHWNGKRCPAYVYRGTFPAHLEL